MKKFLFGLVVGALMLPYVGLAQSETPTIEMYHGQECPHCHRQFAFYPTLKYMYPNLEIDEYEVWHNDDNREQMEARLKELDLEPSGVPTSIIGEEVISGFRKTNLTAALNNVYGAPIMSLEQAEAQRAQYLEENPEEVPDAEQIINQGTAEPKQELQPWVFWSVLAGLVVVVAGLVAMTKE